ncbi:MAG: ArgR family transcriptional regulator [Bacteroidales bacterium]|nr:ArgR family transcriptional regulator [Bacteroidales bacterium]
MNNYTSKDKIERIRLVRSLIREKNITSQEELLDHIKERGVHTTQATLSRDLKYLKATKKYDGTAKEYVYVLPENKSTSGQEIRFAMDEFISLDFSGNIAVIKTSSGFANAIAIYIDRIYFEEVVGTVAGDDTILIVLREGVSYKDFVGSLLEHIPELKNKVDIDWQNFIE